MSDAFERCHPRYRFARQEECLCVMTVQRLDSMIEITALAICDPTQALDRVPYKLASKWPEAPALELTVALASAADATQDVFDELGETGRRAQYVWRLAAMVGADVHYLMLGDTGSCTAGDLLAFWQHVESS